MNCIKKKKKKKKKKVVGCKNSSYIVNYVKNMSPSNIDDLELPLAIYIASREILHPTTHQHLTQM